MKIGRTARLIGFLLILAAALWPALPASLVQAAASLSIAPITWNVVGLDSNNVSVGPNHFPVGARVCNSGTGADATNVTSSMAWTSSDPYIDFRPGTSSSYSASGINLAPGACFDFYYEVEVTRNSAAYNHARRYTISASANSGALTATTPAPREIFVERLVSQSRNSVTAMAYSTDDVSYTPVAVGGTMNLMVGGTYWIKLTSGTATNGYNQLESFISLPNTIFQVLSVSTSYAVDSSLPAQGGYVPNPSDKLYGDGCLWNNDPGSVSYRSCTGIDGKVGGAPIYNTYKIKILSAPVSPMVNPEPLTTLVYDFSGSSFHYNADFSSSVRYLNVVDPTISKSFSPKSMLPGGNSALTFTIKNPGTSTLSGVNFTDTFPTGMTTYNTTTSTSGCSASSSPSLVAPIGGGSFLAGQASISASSISIAAGGTCTVTVNVTASPSVDTTYNNTSGHLYYDTSIDTGHTASDSLTVTTLPPAPSTCTTPVTLARWTMPVGGTTPPTSESLAAGVNSATATATLISGTQATTSAGVTTNAWNIDDAWSSGTVTSITGLPYFQFALDTTRYGGLRIDLKANLNGNGWASNPNYVYIFSSSDNSAYTMVNGTGTSFSKNGWEPVAGYFTGTAAATALGTTYFRVTFSNKGTQQASGNALVDDITIYGCDRPTPPTLTKAFSAPTVKQDTTINPGTTASYATLTFTLGNPNATNALTGVAFTDTLPAGLVIANPPTVSTPSCTTGTLTGQTITANAFAQSLTFSGGTLSAGASTCTFSVRIQGQAAGAYTNVTSAASSTYTGPTGGYGSANLTVIAPPRVTKSFGASSIFTGGSTTLTFEINNPNFATALTGVGFKTADSLPAGMVVATPNGLTGPTCTTGSISGSPVITADAGTGSINFTGATLSAGAQCFFSVNVTGNTTGLKTNSVTITSTEVGDGNTSTADLNVRSQTPGISILKQVSTSPSGPWSSFLTLSSTPTTVYFRFSVDNTGDTALSGVRVNDLTNPGLDLSDCTTALSGGLAVYDSVSCVSGGLAVSSSGVYSNTANATSETATSANSTVNYATAGINLIKNVAESYFTAAGNLLHYTYNVTNNGASNLAGPVTVSDNKATVTCEALTGVGDYDSTFDIGESVLCTATYTVTEADMTAGKVTNTAQASASGTNSNTATKTVYNYNPDFLVAVTDNTNHVATVGTAFTWTVNPTNQGPVAGTFSDGQTIFSMPLPAGPIYGSPTAWNFTNITNPGYISCAIATNTLTCSASGGSVTLGAVTGSFAVSFSTTPQSTSPLSVTATVDPALHVPEALESNNTGQDPITLDKATPTLSTTASGPVKVGSGITDTAHLSGGFNLTGTVSFSVYAPGDTTCATALTPAPTSAAVDGAGDYTSGAFTTAAYGIYRWRAFYSGDANNNAVSGACNDANETSEAIAIDAVNDTGLAVKGPVGGTSVFTVLSNDTLNGVAATTGTVTINRTSLPALPAGLHLNLSTGEVTVDADTPSGTYQFDYTICDSTYPSLCDTATVTVPVIYGTGVNIVNFSAISPASFKAQVSWTTVLEIDTLGFNLYRGPSPAGPWERLNLQLIPAKTPGDLQGSQYNLLDAGILPGVQYYYRLEALDAHAEAQVSGVIGFTQYLSFLPFSTAP